MAKINFFGDFKANSIKHLNMSAELVYLLNTSDINVVNFEAPIKTEGKPIRKSGPNISQHIEAPEWLEERGFNAISLANNHMMDYGETGLTKTKEAFKSSRLMGAGSWDDAYKIHEFTTRDNLRIGIICCTHCEFGTVTDKKHIGLAHALNAEIQRLIFIGRGKYDALIIFNHGGIEHIDVPLPEWRDIYKLWIDLGADAVIASHPHVPQGYEWYKEKPICYSLGNFCFDMLRKRIPAHWYESLCCTLEFDSPHHIQSMNIRPIIYDAANGYIKDNASKDFAIHMENLNALLQDDAVYMKRINKEVMRLLPHYMGMFSRGGFVTGIFQKEFMKGFVEGLMGRGFWNYRHALNNIRCESHRWAIERALGLKHERIK